MEVADLGQLSWGPPEGWSMSRLLLLALSLSLLPLPAAGSEGGSVLWVEAGYRAEARAGAAFREYRAMLGVSLPYDAWWPGNPSSTLARDPEPEAESPPSADTDPPRQGTEGEPKRGDAPSTKRPASEPAAPTSPEQVANETAAAPRKGEALPRLLLTPRLMRETLRQALKAQELSDLVDRVGALSSRARWSAVLPELRLRAARSTDQSLRLAPTLDDPYRYTRDGGTGVTLEARLSWQLSKLVFAPAELPLERLRAARADQRRALSRMVLKVLFAWQRALLVAQDANALDEERGQASIEALEAELELNVLTGGWFDAQRAREFAPADPPENRDQR